MGRDIAKVRRVGQSLVVTLTQDILNEVDISEGERVLLEPVPPRRVIISKESENLPSTRRLELELAVLEKKKTALESESRFIVCQHNNSMPVEPGMENSDIVELTLKELKRDLDRIDVEIAEKNLELFDAQGA